MIQSAGTGRVAVIGGGLAGLSAACTLAARGYAVTVFEKSVWLGGKAAVLEAEGYRFDMGPTILTLPGVLRRIFAEAGVELSQRLELLRLDPQWRCFFEDGSRLDLVADVQAMSQNIEQLTHDGKSAEGYRNFIRLSQRLHSISDRFFFWKPIGGIGDMFSFRGSLQWSVLGDVMQMRMGRSVGATVRKYVPDARVAQMIDHFTQYVGSCPDQSPAVLCGIAHMQTEEGVWYPKGGTGAVPRALVQLGKELGVEYRTETGVRQILLSDRRDRVVGIETETSEVWPCEAVISNADAVRTHRELLRVPNLGTLRFERQRDYEPACSGVVLYLGLDRRYEHLAHHGFVFSNNPHEEFEAIYQAGEPAPDPTAYICAPSISEPEVAPPGCEALYVLVHTPYLRPHHDWKRMFPAYREIILDKLERVAGMTDLRKHIRFEAHLTPQDIHDRYRVLNGAIYGIASHGKWFGAFKPNNRSKEIRGLYLAGGAAHPGPGMPMVLMSGWIAANALDQDSILPKTKPVASALANA